MNQYYLYSEFTGRDGEQWYVLKWIVPGGGGGKRVLPIVDMPAGDQAVRDDMQANPQNYPKPDLFNMGPNS